MPSILIIGATRGLGASLANLYASQSNTIVFGTTRSTEAPENNKLNEKILWIKGIDMLQKDVGHSLVNQLGMLGGGGGMVEGGVKSFDVVIITAGYFATEDWTNGPDWDKELKMYTTSAIAPPFIVHSLFRSKHLQKGSKVILVSSESGSIGLRHEKEGGGNYAHHASKAASNMVGKLLSLDLKDDGVIISIVHPGFMRTEMTKGVGFDKFWDDGGAVTPDEAAKSLAEWAEKLDMSKSGQYWAPRGSSEFIFNENARKIKMLIHATGDIGTAEVVMGKGLPTPLQLPW